jgi:hypothetical protein
MANNIEVTANQQTATNPLQQLDLAIVPEIYENEANRTNKPVIIIS